MSLIDNYLKLTPRTGKMVDSVGNIINEADSILDTADRDISQASRDGKLYRVYWIGTIPVGETYSFVIFIPTGYQLYGITRDQVLGSGSLDINFAVGGTYTTFVDEIFGKNFDEVIGDVSVCSLRRATDLTGASQRTASFHESPTQNPRSVSSTQTEAGAHPRFDETNFPVFQYANTGGAPIRIALNLIWQQIPLT